MEESEVIEIIDPVKDKKEEFKATKKISYLNLLNIGDEEMGKNDSQKEEGSFPLTLREAITNKKSKFIQFIENYVTHKFFFNLIFVLKIALGKQNPFPFHLWNEIISYFFHLKFR